MFSVNYFGPHFSIGKRDHKKKVQFILGEHLDFFSNVAKIYRKVEQALGITGLVPKIFTENETKVKGQIAYEPK